MLEKTSIILIENTVSRCVQWDRRLCAHHSLVAKQIIAIKNSRYAERVYSLQKVRQLRSVTEPVGLRHTLPSATNEIQKNRNRGLV